MLPDYGRRPKHLGAIFVYFYVNLNFSEFNKNVHLLVSELCTRWFKYDRACLHLFTHKSFPVIFEPPCIPIENIYQIRTDTLNQNTTLLL
jgi:hypothetical protein